MLLEMSCSNFKAIKEKITFSMIASKDNSHEESLKHYNTYRVSRITSIYGANGAGKTTLIDAVGYMLYLVQNSAKFQEGDKILRMPHKLAADKPTIFDIQFVVNNNRYAYGFSINDDQVNREYLYHFPLGRQAKIFDREGLELTYGTDYKKELSQLENKLKPNKLFLSTAESWSRLDEIVYPFRFFKEELVVHSTDSDNWLPYSAEQIKNNPVAKKTMIDFMQRIGIPVLDIKVKIENRQLTPQDIPLEILSKLQVLSGNLMSNVIQVKFVYDGYELDLQEESLGTQKLFKLICPMIDVLVNGKVLFYDELEDSLHPTLVDELIRTFKEWDEKSSAQMIFSTHDTSLLDLDVFRRDQIWFAERNPSNVTTEYYSLIELKNVRKDENIKKGYITGRYSSIPLRGSNLIEILEEQANEGN